jgi:predicted DsbA family dithiol-disulfide isomerase
MTAVVAYVDLLCPWAYQASAWLREVRPARGLTIDWRVFSLEEQNRRPDQKHPWERPWSYSWSLLRIVEHVRREQGPEAVDRFCETAGRLLHEGARPVQTPAGARDAVRELGWDDHLVDDAVGDETTNELVRAAHADALALGVHGVPTLQLDGSDLLFGPVMAPPPTGDAALRLWDHLAGWREFPSLFEVVRVRDDAAQAAVQATFEPYRIGRGFNDDG